MKIRQVPEDFRVEEVSDLDIKSGKDAFKVYSLEKKGIEALHALRHIAKSSNVPFSVLGYAGLKDKHAVTSQFITVPVSYSLKELVEDNLRLSFIGYSSKALRLGALIGNKFIVTVRAVRKGEFEGIKRKSENPSVPNYFDSQRFGSVFNGDFIIKHVLRGDYEGAVKLFLVGVSRTDSRIVREDKRLILKSWPMFQGVKVNTVLFQRVIHEYLQTNDWRSAYNAIPSELRNLFSNAFVSYLWNECVKALLRKYVKKKFLYKLEYILGDLLFFRKGVSSVPGTFRIGDDEVSARILEKEGVTLDDLKSFNLQERRVIIVPHDFSVSKPEIDELNDKGKKNFFKITVRFTLPPGSYATIILKRLFNL